MKNRLYLDVHVLQTVPPSCVNRDDTGSPKTAVYGGTTRARVSSQAWKRAIRQMFREEIFPPQVLGARTKRVIGMVENEILNLQPDADAKKLAQDVLTLAGVKFKEEKKDSGKDAVAEALFFMSAGQAEALAKIAVQNDREKKETKRLCLEALKGTPSVDIALFGRMVASDPLLNCDAAAQVAHSISTHTVQNEFDYFTAVDDLASDDTSGAGHLGTLEFNSSTMYRYATVNLMELASSLGTADAAKAARGFVEAFVRSMPTGRQNSYANRTLPNMVYVTIRRDQPVNLCGAFERPVRAGENGYAAESEKRLVKHAKEIYSAYAAEPTEAFAIGEEIGEIANIVRMDTLLDKICEKAEAYLKESEVV